MKTSVHANHIQEISSYLAENTVNACLNNQPANALLQSNHLSAETNKNNCWQNVNFLNASAAGTYSYRSALRAQAVKKNTLTSTKKSVNNTYEDCNKSWHAIYNRTSQSALPISVF